LVDGAILRSLSDVAAIPLPVSIALATDGVREIDRTRASGGGCLTGDAAGFLVTITQAGGC
jgi:hypothetical protein